MTIDMLSCVKCLEAAGVPRQQAQTQTEALRDDVAPQLATKADLQSEIARLESRIEAMLLRHSVAIILGVLAAGSFIVRFLR